MLNKERFVKSEMLSSYNNMYTAPHKRTCARCGARGAGRGGRCARARRKGCIVSRVTLHRFTFHVARNRLRQFFIKFPLGRSGGGGSRARGGRGAFFSARPAPRSFAYATSSSASALRTPTLSARRTTLLSHATRNRHRYTSL